MDSTLNKAITIYGIDNQLEMMVEECSELILAIQKFKRHLRNATTTSNLLSEIADVKIMIKQMELYFGKELINSFVNEKLERLEGNLNDIS